MRTSLSRLHVDYHPFTLLQAVGIVNVNIEDTLQLRRGTDSGLENSNERVQQRQWRGQTSNIQNKVWRQGL